MRTTARPEPSVLWLEEGLPDTGHELPSKTDEASTPNTRHNDHRTADINLTVPPGG
jgi:hypothetical protein